jgi:hypothetical protein
MTRIRPLPLKIGEGSSLADFLASITAQWQTDIAITSESTLMSIREQDHVDSLTAKYKLNIPVLDLASVGSVDIQTRDVLASRFPNSWNPHRRQVFQMEAAILEFPFTGQIQLLQYRVNTFLTGISLELFVDHPASTAQFEVVIMEPNNLARLDNDIQENIGWIQQASGFIIKSLESFNATLKEEILSHLQDQKNQIEAKYNRLSSLRVPLKKRPDAPPSIAVPIGRTKQITINKSSKQTGNTWKPTPYLDDGSYRQILDLVLSIGRSLEQLPAAFQAQDEETLRDFFLIFLASHFEIEGSVTAETYNKAGKTDLLMRYRGDNVFVAECKFWTGPRAFHAAIDQLLGYLTWRDSKAALLLFVRNKRFADVLATIERELPGHPLHRTTLNTSLETATFSHTFALPDDPERTMTLTVLAFSFPIDASRKLSES